MWQAYRDLARLTHPDKVAGAEAKAESEKKFMDIAEAYEVCSGRRIHPVSEKGNLKLTLRLFFVQAGNLSTGKCVVG